MTRPLIVDHTLREQCRVIADYAASHVCMVEDGDCPGDKPEHVLNTTFGYRVVYSHDFFKQLGIVRRMSISVRESGKLPNIPVVQEFANMFNFDYEHCTIQPMPISEDGKHQCVVVAQILEQHGD